MQNQNQWPQWFDYNDLPLSKAAAILTEFSAIHVPECLWVPGNFKHIAFKDPFVCGILDILEALRVVIDTINANPDDESLAELGKRISWCLGPLDKPIAITLIGHYRYNGIIEPDAWLREVHRVELSQADVAEIVHDYSKVRGLESMVNLKQMRHLSFSDILAFAPSMQRYTLNHIINAVNAARNDAGMVKLGRRLKRRLGMLTASISLSLQGYKTEIHPDICMKR
nr:hypothetical protein [uncultured Duganella sp.]